MQKMSARSIPIYPVNLATFEESYIFGAPFGRCDIPKHDVIYEILRSTFFLTHCESFISRSKRCRDLLWPFLRGGGLHIRKQDTSDEILHKKIASRTRVGSPNVTTRKVTNLVTFGQGLIPGIPVQFCYGIYSGIL